jgi:hypothetical protein
MTQEEIEALAGHRKVPPWVVKLVGDAVAKEREHCAARAAIALLGTLKTTRDSVLHAIRHRGQQ